MPQRLSVDRNLAQSLWHQGFHLAEISAQLGVAVPTLRQWSHRYRWPQTPRPPAAPLPAQDQQVTERITNLVIVQAERIICKIRDTNLDEMKECKEAATALASAYTTARKALGLDEEGAQTHLHLHVLGGKRLRTAPDTDVIDVAPVQTPAEGEKTEAGPQPIA